MKDEGLLSEQEVLRMTLPLAGRTLEDITAPFSQDGKFGSMALEAADVLTTPDPFWPEFEETGDAEHLGRCWAGIWRGAVGPTLASALNLDRNPSATLDALFSRFADRVTVEPQEQKNAIAIVVLRKT
jgi:hypothetical protein